MEARQRTWPFVLPDARQNLQAEPRGRETRPSNLVLRRLQNEVLWAGTLYHVGFWPTLLMLIDSACLPRHPAATYLYLVRPSIESICVGFGLALICIRTGEKITVELLACDCGARN